MRGTPYRFDDFTGGLVALSTGASGDVYAGRPLDDNQAISASNVVCGRDGSLARRFGCSTFNTSGATITAAATSLGASNATTSKFLLAFAGTKLYSITMAGVVTDVTASSVYTTGTQWDFANAPTSGGQGPVYMQNGTDLPKYWDGSAVGNWTAASGSLPNGGFLCSHLNRVWVAGDSSFRSRLYFSDVGDPRAWPAANVVDIEPADGDVITGLGTVGPYLLVFKGHKTFIVYDDATGANRRISSGVGCASHYSIAETPYGTAFLGGDKRVYLTDGTTVTEIGDNIRGPLSAIPEAYKGVAAGGYFKGHYYLSHNDGSGSTVNVATKDYDFEHRSWWGHTNAASRFAVIRSSTTTEGLYQANAAAANVQRCYDPATFQDLGVSVAASHVGALHTFGNPSVPKRVRQVRVAGRSAGNITLTLYGGSDQAYSGEVSKAYTISLAAGNAVAYTPGVAHAWAVGFSETANSELRIFEYTLAVNAARKAGAVA